MDVEELKARARAYNQRGERIDTATEDNRPPVYMDTDGRWVYRASGVGGLCPRALWLARTGVDPSPIPESLAKAYMEGANNEPVILAMFEQTYDIRVHSQQDEYEIEVPGLDGVVIRGHIDGLGDDHVMERTGVVEAKKVAESGWGSPAHMIGLYPGWLPQIHLAMRGTETRIAWEVFGKSVDGVVEEIRYGVQEYDRRIVAQVFDKVRQVELAVSVGEPILCPEEVWGCPYWQLHDGIDNAREVIEDQTMAVLAREVAEFSRQAKVAEERAKATRAELAELLKARKVKTATVTGRGTGEYVVTWVTPTRTVTDKEAMERDGVDLTKYQTKTEGTPYVKVTPPKGDE